MPSASCGLHHTHLLIAVITDGFLNGSNHSHYNCCQNPLAPEVLLEWKPEGMQEPEQLQPSPAQPVSELELNRIGGKAQEFPETNYTLLYAHKESHSLCSVSTRGRCLDLSCLCRQVQLCVDTSLNVFIHRNSCVCARLSLLRVCTPWGPHSLNGG